MILDLVSLIHQIVLTPAIEKAHRSHTIIGILKKFNLDPTHPPEDFDSIYAYALVEYAFDENGKKKNEEVLQVFRLSKIREAFKKAFYSMDKSIVNEAVDDFVKDEPDLKVLGDKILNDNIDLRQELEQFTRIFIEKVEKSKKPKDIVTDQKIDDLQIIIADLLKLIGNKNNFAQSNITGFEALIKEKARLFCGRKFVFEKIDDFIAKNSNGYFVVVGDAGMGKSAIAAKYVSDHQAICFFNILSEHRNTPEQFLKTIRQQLINRYDLQNVEQADLSTLITEVAAKIHPDEHLIIVVDALDEVEQEPSVANILYLPETLPDRVYFLLTRRPYKHNKKRLRVSVAIEELSLTAKEYQIKNREDIEEYIDLFIKNDIEYKDAIKKWINERNITTKNFREQVAEKSENNFMYVRYILPAIARGFYDDLSLQQLPDGLQEYYQTHWVRMGMDNKPQELMVKILFILVEIGTPITLEMIAVIAQQDEYDVQSILDEWVEYLKPQEIEAEICYSIYHASFLDFLKAKRVLDSKRKIFEEVNQSISDILY
ncbi:MAG: NACHT domain protein [Rivularia sp. (in: cyanobacteria)]